MLKQAVRLHGKAWPQVAGVVSNKSEEQCKLYFYRNKKKLGLNAIYLEYKKKKVCHYRKFILSLRV